MLFWEEEEEGEVVVQSFSFRPQFHGNLRVSIIAVKVEYSLI
jgi:hypothetical protein